MIAPEMPSETGTLTTSTIVIVPVQEAFSLFTRRSLPPIIHGFRLRCGGGPGSTSCDCGCTDSTPQGCNWPTTPRSMPCWRRVTGVMALIARSRHGRRFGVHSGGDPVGVRAGHLDAEGVRGGGAETGDRSPVHRPVHRRLPRVGAHRVLLGLDTGAGRVHQDRQQPCPPAADRSGLASPSPISTGTGFAPTVGSRVARPGAGASSES